MTLLYPIMILSPAINEPVHLWNVPNRCIVSIAQPSQSSVAPVPTCLEKHVGGIKLKRSKYVKTISDVFSLISIFALFKSTKEQVRLYKHYCNKECNTDTWLIVHSA